MKLCKGGCGLEATFGNWCSNKYQDCSGYRKKLSDIAKLRGNNGVRGILSKKYTDDDKIVNIYHVVCNECGKPFDIKLKGASYKRHKEFYCLECNNKHISAGMLLAHNSKVNSTPYELKSMKYRKLDKWEQQGHKCNKCGYNQYDLFTGPYEIHHIDGNANNKSLENEELLCCNCHAMTDNYRFKNGSHSAPTKFDRFGGVYT